MFQVSPSWKGARSEAALLAALVACGKTVLIPWGQAERYDLVVAEPDGRFIRVQCKTGSYHHGAVWFRTCSADRRHPSGESYAGQIDAFGVHCPELGSTYLVPARDVPSKQLSALRVDAPANGQVLGIRWARAYELGAGDGYRTRDLFLGADIRPPHRGPICRQQRIMSD
jgi:PD-(D/E)XK endonuclease